MEKRLSLQLNGSRKVVGILRGYDPFMNVVLDDTIEEVSAGEKHNIGMVVSLWFLLLYDVSKQVTKSCTFRTGHSW